MELLALQSHSLGAFLEHLKKLDGDSRKLADMKLIPYYYLDSTGMLPVIPPAEYSGRVNGTISLTSSSGQAAFTLSNIKTSDERLFGCWVESSDIIPKKQFDSVKLVVQGRQLYTVS